MFRDNCDTKWHSFTYLQQERCNVTSGRESERDKERVRESQRESERDKKRNRESERLFLWLPYRMVGWVFCGEFC